MKTSSGETIVKVRLDPEGDQYRITCTDYNGFVVRQGKIPARSLYVAMDGEQYACLIAGQLVFYMNFAKIEKFIR